MRFAGTYHPIPYLLLRIADFLPSVENYNGLWMGYDRKIYTNYENNPLQNALKIKAQEKREQQITSEWTSQLTFFEENNVEKQNSQLSIEDENKLHILQLYFPSPVDGLMDVISIHFPENIFLKSMNLTFQGVSSKEKHILSSFLTSILNAEHQRVTQERKLLLQMEKSTQQHTQKIQTLKDHLNTTEELYSSAVRTIVNDSKSNLEKELNKSFHFDQDVIAKLAKERLTINEIEIIVKDAIFLAYNLNVSAPVIQIENSHITWDSSTTARKEEISVSDSRKQKAKYLLDRYEKAAEIVVQKGLSINGKNIAAQLDPPVTPPAITDAVKKNQTKIGYFLEQYPSRWSKIRKYIRPIASINETGSQMSSAS